MCVACVAMESVKLNILANASVSEVVTGHGGLKKCNDG